MNRRLISPVLVPSLLALSLFVLVTVAHADVPPLSSRSNAAYTVYLDFGGFAYDGTWDGKTPGTTAAYGNANLITDTWTRIAEKYSSFDINVTTVDPFAAAGHTGTDADRQAYYDATPRMMHTIIGNNSAWYPNAGGVSYVGVTQNSVTNGLHTDWLFGNNLGNSSRYIGEAGSHENGHGFGLDHQSDYKLGGTTVNEYSTNNNARGNGSYAPILGVSYYSQRGVWRAGTTDFGTIQDDVAIILSNSGMSLVDDTIGHSFAAATTLTGAGGSVSARGIITPVSTSSPTPLGVDNYTKDYFKFTVGTSGAVSLSVSDGSDRVTSGVVSGGATLRSKLNLYGAGNLLTPLGFGIESANTLSESYSGTLTAGDYYAEVTSFGGYQSSYDPSAKYYDMGSYVLSGSGFGAAGVAVVPEAGTAALMGFAALLGGFVLPRVRRQRSALAAPCVRAILRI